MVYTMLPNGSNGSDIGQIILWESQQIPFLFPGILLLIFFVIVGSGYFSQERRIGRGNFPMWCAIAGLITTSGAFILFLYDGLVGLETVIICVVVSIVCALWFLLSSNE